MGGLAFTSCSEPDSAPNFGSTKKLATIRYSSGDKTGSSPSPSSGSDSTPNEMPPSTPQASPQSPQMPGPATPVPTPATPAPSPSDNTGSNKSACRAGDVCLDFNALPSLAAAADWKEAEPNCKGTSTLNLDKAFDPAKMQTLRVDAQGGYCNHAFLSYSRADYFKNAELYIRFYWAIRKALTDAHVTFVTFHDAKENKDIRWGGQASVSIWNRESDDATVPELSPQGIIKTFTPSANTFHCVEMHFTPAKALIEFKVDGKVVEGLSVTATANSDVDGQWKRKANYSLSLDDIKLGYESYGSDSNTVWYKDVVLSTRAIGCK